MTTSRLGCGEEVACVMGGWGDDEVSMQPHLLRRDADGVHHWAAPTTTGSVPDGRAFHSCTEVAPACMLVYGGLGSGCCRTDVALLELDATRPA